MGKLTDALTFRATAQSAASTLKEPAQWVTDWFGVGSNTASGEEVTVDSAHKHAAYWACVNVLSQSVASLPYNTYKRRSDGGRDQLDDHPISDLLKTAPNGEMSSFSWRQTKMGHILTWGNHYSLIETTKGGKVTAIWPLRPDRMKVKRLPSGNIVYEYQTRDDDPSAIKTYQADDIFHVPGYGFDGLVGYSPTRMAMESIGWSLGTVKFGARFFGNRSTPSGVLTHPRNVSDDAAQRMKTRVESAVRGENQSRLLVLEEGLEWTQIGIPQNEAQFIETMNFQVEDMCRWFNVPPSLIHHLARATFTNVEHMDLSFVKHSIRPWCVRLEQEVDRQLLTQSDRSSGVYTKMVMDALLRGDSASRNAIYATGRQWGYLSANDVRALEEMNPIEDGDQYLVPVNMTPADQAGLPDEEVDPDPEEDPINPGDGAPGDDGTVPGGRSKRSAKRSLLRRDLRNGGLGFFESTAARLVRREVKALRKAHSMLADPTSVARFTEWLVEFYEEFRPAVQRDLHAVIASFGDQIRAAAMSELDDVVDLPPHAMDELIESLAVDASFLWTNSSRKSINEIVEKNHGSDGMVPALEARLNRWEETHATSVANNESTRVGGAVALLVFGASGVDLVWDAGSAECDLCAQLDGQVVGRGAPFVPAGGNVNPQNGGEALTAKDPVLHPPLHRGCDCIVSPESK